MKTIYNTYVEMQSQEQYNRLKNICIEFGQHVYGYDEIFDGAQTNFHCNDGDGFSGWINPLGNQTKVTEQEFIELLKNRNDA